MCARVLRKRRLFPNGQLWPLLNFYAVNFPIKNVPCKQSQPSTRTRRPRGPHQICAPTFLSPRHPTREFSFVRAVPCGTLHRLQLSRDARPHAPRLPRAGPCRPPVPFPAGNLPLSRPALSSAGRTCERDRSPSLGSTGPASHQGGAPRAEGCERDTLPYPGTTCLDREPQGAWTLSLPAFVPRTELSACYTGGSVKVLCLTRLVREPVHVPCRTDTGRTPDSCPSRPNPSFWLMRPCGPEGKTQPQA